MPTQSAGERWYQAEESKSLRPLHETNSGRYFHRMSVEPPYESKFPISKAPNVVPKAFEGVWEGRVDEWGFLLKQS